MSDVGVGWNVALAQRAIQLAIEKAVREARNQQRFIGGTVTTASGGTQVAVLIDGDTTSTTMVNATGRYLRAGDRVLVAFLPPQGMVALSTFAGDVRRVESGGELVLAGTSLDVDLPPSAASQHAAGEVWRYTFGSTTTQASGANLGIASRTYLAGRRYLAHVVFPLPLATVAGTPTWQAAFYAGTDKGYRRWVTNNTSGGTADFWYGFTASGTVTTQVRIDRITGSGNLQLNTSGAEPSITMECYDAGPA